MTTIVKHRRTGNEYILLGINGEAGKTNPSRFISELFNQEKSEVSCSATVCDVQGNIFLAYIDDLVVTEIDGRKPEDLLPEPNYESVNNDYQQSTEFESDEELDVDDFESEQNTPEIKTNSEASFLEGLGSPIKSNSDTEDDDEDWI